MSARKVYFTLIFIVVFSSAFYFLSLITADPDLWGHIKFGEDLWRTRAFPLVDPYSFTAGGKVWINHEWLSELIMYLVFHFFGSSGLIVGKLIIGVVIIFFLSKISLFRQMNHSVYGVIFVGTIFIISPGFMTRPQLATFLFTTFFFYIFHLYLERKVNYLWCLPVVMILWVNSHGGFLIGAGMFPVVIISEFLSCLVNKKDKTYLYTLMKWMVVTELSVLINPYGFNLLIFLKDTIGVPRNITEWEPVSLFDFSYLRFKIYTLCVIVSFFINKKGNRWWEISVIIIALINAYFHQRHTPVFAILAAPFLCEKLSYVARSSGKYNIGIRSSESYIILSVALLVLAVFQISVTIDKFKKTGFNIIVDPGIYPVRAVNFLIKYDICGNIMVPFDWGEYVIWHLYPRCKVSVDGRFRTAYPEKVLEDHVNTMYNPSTFIKIIDSYPSDVLLLKNNPVSLLLKKMPEKWLYIYSDPTALIYMKNNKETRQVVQQLKNQKNVLSPGKVSIYFP